MARQKKECPKEKRVRVRFFFVFKCSIFNIFKEEERGGWWEREKSEKKKAVLLVRSSRISAEGTTRGGRAATHCRAANSTMV